MKDSGIDWIGEIPEDWEICKIKYLFDIDKNKLPENTEEDYTFNYIDISSVNELGQISNAKHMIFEKSPSRARMIVSQGDIIVSTVRTYLKAIARINESNKYICSTGFAVLTPSKKINSKFAYYQVQSEYLIQEIVSRSVGVSYPAISSTAIGTIYLVIPNVQKQQRIADYLDQKCFEIDKVIAAKEKQNELLKEQRQSIIYEAVTKGLNKNVKFKDSGIEWIGEIPEDWEVRKLKYLCKNITEKAKVYEDNSQDLIMYLGLEHIEQQTGKVESSYEPIYDFNGDTIIFSKNDIIFGKLRPYLAKCYLTETDGKCSSEFFVLRPEGSIIAKYLKYLMLSRGFIDYVNSSTLGVKMPRADWGFVGNIFIPYTKVATQRLIADYLDQKCGELDRIISSNNEMLIKLKEYRQSIIYEAVTGKVQISS